MTLDKPQPAVLEYARGMLNIEYTFTNGQMFRWRRTDTQTWDAVCGGRVLRIRQITGSDDVDRFEVETYPEPDDMNFVHRFLRLDVDLAAVYSSWQEADPHLGSLTSRFKGLRLVLQEPEECLLSFVCSTANFIPRIMKAIATISRNWGQQIIGPGGVVITHRFPPAQVIAGLDPTELAEATGLEWRAANLVKVAKQLSDRPDGWLDNIASLDYPTARGELTRLDGVGPKIADCVCLFAMARDQAVPVDTHVWQLTRDHYLPSLRRKSVSAAGYAQVLNFYQSKFVKAGWAQQYLFYDHLLASRERKGRRE